MQPYRERPIDATLRAVGSLWFGGVILMLLLLAMACATVFESSHGSEQALGVFYRSWWFELGLGLLGANVAAALLVRYPFIRRRLGFVVTHAGILLVLGGALVTEYFGVNGQLGLAEGDTAGYFTVPENTLTLTNPAEDTRSVVHLKDSAFSGFEVVERPSAPVLTLDDIRVEVERYLPDAVLTESVTDDSPHASPAVEVSISPSGRDDPKWVFPGRPTQVGLTRAAFRIFQDAEALARLVESPTSAASTSKGEVKVEFEGATFAIPIEESLSEAVPLGETGYTLRTLRYMPHATVGPDRKVTNASPDPVNPAVEVELSGRDGNEKRLVFAKFPDFKSMHGQNQREDIRVTLSVSETHAPQAPAEVLGGPQGEMYVRFSWEGTAPVVRELAVGEAVETPWPGEKFTLLRRFDHARRRQSMVPPDRIRQDRTPALLARIGSEGDSSTMWLWRRQAREFSAGGKRYVLAYGDKQVPLGFTVKLNRFRLGYYPGSERPRSFESHVSIVDATTGREQSRVISMNHPTKYGGYSFFQSRYRMGSDQTISFLSVSRDPGMWVVFAGYIATMVGMVLVLVTRMRDRRRATAPAATARSGAQRPAAGMRDLTVLPSHGDRSDAGSDKESVDHGRPRPASPVRR